MGQCRRWSREEDALLKEYWDRVKICTLAKKLNRTETAVKLRAIKFNLGLRRTGYTMGEVAELFGYECPKTVSKWIREGKLKAIESKIHGKRIYSIQEKDIRHFAKHHQDSWDTRRLKVNLWYDNEPDWLIAKIESDKDKPTGRKDRYSKKDDKQIIELFAKGLTRKEIAEVMNRTESGIARRLGRLNYGRTK
jgi:transposase-like protein